MNSCLHLLLDSPRDICSNFPSPRLHASPSCVLKRLTGLGRPFLHFANSRQRPPFSWIFTRGFGLHDFLFILHSLFYVCVVLWYWISTCVRPIFEPGESTSHQRGSAQPKSSRIASSIIYNGNNNNNNNNCIWEFDQK